MTPPLGAADRGRAPSRPHAAGPRGLALGLGLGLGMALALGLGVGLVGAPAAPAAAGPDAPPAAAPDGVAAPAQGQKIRLNFPTPPNLACGGELPKDLIQAVPEDRRAHLVALLERMYPTLVEVYGEPQVVLPVLPGSPPRPLDFRPVDVYFVPRASGSMYLTHKSDVPRAAALLAGAALGAFHPALGVACGLFTEIPDHALFLSSMPCRAGDTTTKCREDFDHLFVHEILHVFHDRMDYLGWFTHSWVEEGMVEAAAELAADLAEHDGITPTVRAGGINAGPWDNLEHLDVWGYPQNGAWSGDGNFSALHGIQYFFGGVALPDADDLFWSGLFGRVPLNPRDAIPGPPGDHGWMNKVIEPDSRYGASAAIWLVLAKALSDDPARPSFLRRLNERLTAADIDRLPDSTARANEVIFDQIEAVAGARTIEGLPVRDWLERQWVARSFPSARGALWIDVRDPASVMTYDPVSKELVVPDITVYALVTDELPSAWQPASWLVRDGLERGELPVRDCPITLRIRAVNGTPLRYDEGAKRWRSELAPIVGLTDNAGRLTLWDALALNAAPLTGVHAPGLVQGQLPPGAYAIYAEAGACPHRVTFRTEGIWPYSGEVSTRPGGMFASTFFMVGGDPIDDAVNGANRLLHGVTTVAHGGGRIWGPGVRPVPVAAAPIVERLLPAPGPLPTGGWPDAGAFRAASRPSLPAIPFSDPALFVPEELLVGLPDPAAPGTLRGGGRLVFRPSPYTRFVDVPVAGDFDLRLAPADFVVDVGGSVTATLTLTPLGALPGAPFCAATVREGTLPRGVTVDFEPNVRFTSLVLDEGPPVARVVTATIRVGPAATPARTHELEFVAAGSPGECADRTLAAPWRLEIPPPIVRRAVDAVVLEPSGPPSAIGPEIELATRAGVTNTIAPFAVDIRQGTTLTLRAPVEISAAGRRLRWVDWIQDGDPTQRDTRNPAPVAAPRDVAMTARYRPAGRAHIVVEATGEGGTVPVRLAVPIRARYPSGLEGTFDVTRTTSFELAPTEGLAVTADAPLDVVADGRRHEFTGWRVGGTTVTTARLERAARGGETWTARYRRLSEARLGLSVFPAVAEVPIGAETTLDVRVDGLAGVYAVHFALSYDPARVAVVDADPARPGVQVAQGAVPAGAEVILDAVDEAAGRIEYLASLAGARPGDDRDGVVARIRFRGRATGASRVSFVAARVADGASRAIDAATRDAALTVAQRVPVVTPHLVTGTIAPGPGGTGARVCAAGSCVDTGPGGSFTLPDLRLGDVISAARPGFLRAARGVWAAPPADGGALTLPPVELVAGDVDGDDEIGAGDAVAIAHAWGAAAGEARYAAAADLDADGRIDEDDLAAVSARFLWHAPGPWPDPPDPTPEPAAPPPLAEGLAHRVPAARRAPDAAAWTALAAAPPWRRVGGAALAAAQPPTTTVRAEAVVVAGVGRAAPVRVVVADAVDLFAYALRVRFDPRVLAVRDADPAREGVQVVAGDALDGAEGMVVFNAADNVAGDLAFAATRRHPAGGRAGGGTLATIPFEAVGAGASPVVLTRVELFDAALPSGGPQPVDVGDGRVTVGGPSGAIYLPYAGRR